jgi:hypothetical protein
LKPLYKSLLLAALHVALVCTLGAKLLYDRAHRPRIWIKSAVYDPNLPIRGRYLGLTIEVPAERFTSHTMKQAYRDGYIDSEYFSPDHCDLVLRGNQLIAVANQDGDYYANVRRHDQDVVAQINNQSLYFVPEHADSALLRKSGEELWFEATIPRKGPPRPIRLGIKKDGVLTPLPAD